MHGLSALAGGHEQGGLGGQGGGVIGDAFGHEGGQTHFFEHIQIVIGSGAVGADAHIQAQFQHALHRRKAGGQLEVGGGVVGHTCAQVLHGADFAFVHMNAVGGQDFGLEQAAFFHVGHHGHAVLFAHVGHFTGGFRNVCVEGHIKLGSQLGRGAQDFGRAGVGGVGGDGRHDEGVVFPALDKITGDGQAFLVGISIGAGELEHRFGAKGAHAGLGGGFGDVLFKVVHIRKAGDAAADHLRAGHLRAQAYKFGRDEFTFNRHHVTHQPHIQAQIVRQAAQEGHGHVGVGVDQAGHEGFTAAIDHLSGGVLGLKGFLGADGDDGIAPDGHGAGFILAEGLIHSEDQGVRQQNIYLFHKIRFPFYLCFCRRWRRRKSRAILEAH